MNLYEQISNYEPYNEQETADKVLMLQALEHYDAEGVDCFSRTVQAHFTCSAWVVDPSRTQTIMVFHNIYNSWSWIGGHADGCDDLQAVALRELQEETGVQHARLLMPAEVSVRTSGQDVQQASPEMPSCLGDDLRKAHAAETKPFADSVARESSPIFSLEVLTVDGHEKNGVYVSSHLHLNVTYLFEVDPLQPLRVKPDENSGVKWVPLNQVVSLSNEPWIRERIYKKLLAKLSF